MNRSDTARLQGADSSPVAVAGQAGGRAAFAGEKEKGALTSPRWRLLDSGHRRAAAVDLAPENAALRARLAHLHERGGDRSQALARYREALELDPDLADARAGRERLTPEIASTASGGFVRRLLARLGVAADS